MGWCQVGIRDDYHRRWVDPPLRCGCVFNGIGRSANELPAAFELQHQDAKTGARAGLLHTRRGIVETPVFMPVGTLATVKGLTPDLVRSTDAKLVLCNTYHLALRPGEDIIDSLGGLHTFMDWPGPILTDSGGFQVFSLAKMNKVTEQGVVFAPISTGLSWI